MAGVAITSMGSAALGSHCSDVNITIHNLPPRPPTLISFYNKYYGNSAFRTDAGPPQEVFFTQFLAYLVYVYVVCDLTCILVLLLPFRGDDQNNPSHQRSGYMS